MIEIETEPVRWPNFGRNVPLTQFGNYNILAELVKKVAWWSIHRSIELNTVRNCLDFAAVFCEHSYAETG